MKKFISLTLSVIIICLGVLPCFAAEEKCNCGEAPIIYVAALGSGSVYQDAGTENEKQLFRPQTDDILEAFAPLVPAAADLLIDADYDAFGDVLIDCVNASFGNLAMDENGNSLPNVTTEEFHPENADHGINHSYYFGYDFREDPIVNAQKLHAYIQEVKEITKHDTVRFRASSMGGVTTLAYIQLYGTEDIETIIFQNCPLQGTAVAGELYNGKVHIDKDALVRYASGALPSMDSDFLAGILITLIDMFDSAGVWAGLVDIADVIVKELKDRVFAEALIPIFGTMPGIWSFVPDEYYESGKVFMQLDPEVNATLIERLDYYHYEVQCNAGDLLKGAQAQGTNIYIVAGYNMQRTPLVEAYMNNSDGTVDTQYASVGATCAYIGEQLPADYKQAVDAEYNYISPDRVIDASTCALPEYTWFVKDMLHCTCHDGHDQFYKVLFGSEEQLTVHDMKEYPQFMQNDTVHQTFYRVESEGTELEEALKDASQQTSFFNIMKLISTFFKHIWKFLMG